MSVAPVLAALRAQTQSSHRALEASLAIALPAAGKKEYAQHVAAMWGWMRPVEVDLWSQPWPAAIEPSQRAQKFAWLEEDIAAACNDGMLATPIALHDPICCDDSEPGRFGRAYVIEGSMLGGALLLRRLAHRLQPWPMRYLHGYQQDGPRYWRAFLDALAERVRTPADIAAAARSANATFTSIARWLRAQRCMTC